MEMAHCQFSHIDLKAAAFSTLNDLKQIIALVDCNNVATEMTWGQALSPRLRILLHSQFGDLVYGTLGVTGGLGPLYPEMVWPDVFGIHRSITFQWLAAKPLHAPVACFAEVYLYTMSVQLVLIHTAVFPRGVLAERVDKHWNLSFALPSIFALKDISDWKSRYCTNSTIALTHWFEGSCLLNTEWIGTDCYLRWLQHRCNRSDIRSGSITMIENSPLSVWWSGVLNTGCHWWAGPLYPEMVWPNVLGILWPSHSSD